MFGRRISGLSEPTRELLARGAEFWDGPSNVSGDLARLMDFEDARRVDHHLRALAGVLRAGGSVSALDLTRVLLLTELGICGNVISNEDWYLIYGGGSDLDEFMHAQFDALMAAQDELARLGVPHGTDPFRRRRRGW